MIELENELISTIREVIADVMDIEESKIDYETDLIEELGLDSLFALQILVNLEKRFQIKIQEEELKELTSLKDAHNLIKKKLDSK